MAEIVPLTQGHLEDHQAAFREAMQAVNEKWQDSMLLMLKSLNLVLTLGSPATQAYPFYLEFLRQAQARTQNGKYRLNKEERNGLMIRAALTTGWLKDAPWKPEDVRDMDTKTATWLGNKLDAIYSDYDYDVDVAQVRAALEAGWFQTVAVMPEEPSEIERLSQLVKNAYRAATELDPE